MTLGGGFLYRINHNVRRRLRSQRVLNRAFSVICDCSISRHRSLSSVPGGMGQAVMAKAIFSAKSELRFGHCGLAALRGSNKVKD
jgi:hypothetical protein